MVSGHGKMRVDAQSFREGPGCFILSTKLLESNTLVLVGNCEIRI
jgi:hypothetical protein